MTTNMKVETPFIFCPLCDHFEPKDIGIRAVKGLPKYRCSYYYICEDAVDLYKRFNEDEKKK